MTFNILSKIKNNIATIKNFGYLSIIQIISMILPLFTIPYLLKTLNYEQYGLIIYSQTCISYLVILVSFGFNLLGVREISIHRNNPDKINEILSSITILKSILFLIAYFILFTNLHILNLYKSNTLIFHLSMYLCFQELFSYNWYFQGIEKMKYITIITVITKLIFFVSIFVFVKNSDDYLKVPIINSIGACIAVAITLWILIINHKIKFIKPNLESLKYYFNHSISFFISNVSVQVFVNLNKLIIGSFLGMIEIAIYDVAEKIYTLLKTPYGIFTQVMLPKLSKNPQNNHFKKLIIFSGLAGFILCIITFLGSNIIESIIANFTHKSLNNLSFILKILSIAIIFSFINMGSSLAFISLKKDALYMYGVGLAAIFYCLIFLLYYLINYLTLFSICSMTVLVEFFLVIYSIYFVKKLKII